MAEVGDGVVAVDVRRRVVLGQLAYAGPANASALLRPVVDLARQTGTIALVVADAEFDSERVLLPGSKPPARPRLSLFCLWPV